MTPSILILLTLASADQHLEQKEYAKAWKVLSVPKGKKATKARDAWMATAPALEVVQAARAAEGRRKFPFCVRAFAQVAKRLPELKHDLGTRALSCARKAKDKSAVESQAKTLLEGPHRDVGLLALAGLQDQAARTKKKGESTAARKKEGLAQIMVLADQCDSRWCKARVLALGSALARDEARWKIDERLVRDFSDLLAGREAWNRSRRALKADKKASKRKPPKWRQEFGALALLGRAETLLAAHQNQDAVDATRQVLKASDVLEHQCRAYAALGRALRKLRKHREAVKAYGSFQKKKCPGAVGAGVAYGRIFSQVIVDPKPIPELVKQALKDHPKHRLSDDYLFFLGEHHQRKSRQKKATEAYELLVKRYPDGDMAEEAAWRVAWTYYLAEDHGGALQRLDQFLRGKAASSSHQSDDQIRALYWRARLSPKKGRNDRYAALIDAHPFSWHALLARQRVGKLDSKAEQARFPEVQPARDPSPKLNGDTRFRRGIGLLALGLNDQAVALLSSIGTSELAEPDLEALADRLILAGGAHHAVGMLRRLSVWRQAPSPTSGRLWRLAYPLGFKDEVLKAAEAQGVPAALLFGLVREESGFDAEVDSWAGARGLSQCMKPTARMVARKYRVNGWTWAKMREPEMNLKIGSLYLSGLLKRFDGALPLAISSYNAGPGATRRMIKQRAKFPLDAWVEDIPIRQTRKYVQRVLSSAWVYANLYPDLGGLDLGAVKIVSLK